MAQKLTSSIPADMDLDQGYTLRFTAVDAASGATVTAVKVSDASLLVANLAGGDDQLLQTGPFMLVPGPQA